MGARTEKDVAWSTLRQTHICLHCGEPAILLSTGPICLNGDDCLRADEDEEQDCAPEGMGLASIRPAA